ncbi:MAG: alpha/beta hydrolase [Gemmatimonadaceae bacterium]|nr:alpha/beta hydrolase [Gloeobacterales cyanobacterium ES-bin-141]
MSLKPTIFTVPCFAGAPWDLSQLSNLSDYELRTMRLPESARSVEEVADFIEIQVRGYDNYVLVGDSFGAVAALAFAVRMPRGLRALALSGGFAKNPITSIVIKAFAALAPFFAGPFYRGLTLRYHAYALRSVFDGEGEIPWSQARTRDFFVRETSHRAYVNRAQAVFSADYLDHLSQVSVPTLILTPEEDNLIGSHAAGQMLRGIPGAREVILPRTGHMFRFSHPKLYSTAIRHFLDDSLTLRPTYGNADAQIRTAESSDGFARQAL